MKPVRYMQELFDSVPEPGEGAEPRDHALYIMARCCRWLLSWQGLAVWATAEAVAIALEVWK